MNDSELHESIGYIKAKVEKIDNIEVRLGGIEKKVSRIFGWASGIASAVSVGFILLKDWFFKDKI